MELTAVTVKQVFVPVPISKVWFKTVSSIIKASSWYSLYDSAVDTDVQERFAREPLTAIDSVGDGG